MFQQVLNPTWNLFITWLLALIPVIVLLILLAVFRLSAWISVLIGAVVTFLLAVIVWQMPIASGIRAYIYGALTGAWAVDWITFWGVMLFNSLSVTGVFDQFRRWLTAQGTADVRAQTILFAWAFGALLEGLVGFGYPCAFVAPILIGLGIPISTPSASPQLPIMRRFPTAPSECPSSPWPPLPDCRCSASRRPSLTSSRCWHCCLPGY